MIRNAVEEAVLAEAVGIDSFNIGEHYRTEFMDSANHVVLAAIAGRTERIRLGTAVTVLSTQDPVRLYTDFATLDAVSNGRAQLIVGRGSLTDSFPLFGYDLADYEELFEEKLDLLVRLLREQPVTWSGNFRSPLTDQLVSPPIPEGHIPTWVGVGGSPNSVAARGPVRPSADARHHRRQARALRALRRPLRACPRAARKAAAAGRRCTRWGSSPRRTRRPSRSSGRYYKEQFEWAARERGWRPPTYEQFLAEVDHGSMYVGSPETVANRIAAVDADAASEPVRPAYAVGRVPHEQRLATIDLYGREVIPRVRELLAGSRPRPGADDAGGDRARRSSPEPTDAPRHRRRGQARHDACPRRGRGRLRRRDLRLGTGRRRSR